MPRPRVAMRKIRDVLRLTFAEGLSRQVGLSLVRSASMLRAATQVRVWRVYLSVMFKTLMGLPSMVSSKTKSSAQTWSGGWLPPTLGSSGPSCTAGCV